MTSQQASPAVQIDAGDVAALARRVRRLAEEGSRVMIGIVGAPGSGKSTLAEQVRDALDDRTAVVVPMDGFHLATSLLSTAQLTHRGTPDTFDASGYVALLERLRDDRDDVIYGPRFSRETGEPIGSAIAVSPETRVVLTEGNYLLADTHPWHRVRELLDEAWFIRLEPDLRRERLSARHVRFGSTPDEARALTLGSDEDNAMLVERTAHRAHVVVTTAASGRTQRRVDR